MSEEQGKNQDSVCNEMSQRQIAELGEAIFKIRKKQIKLSDIEAFEILREAYYFCIDNILSLPTCPNDSLKHKLKHKEDLPVFYDDISKFDLASIFEKYPDIKSELLERYSCIDKETIKYCPICGYHFLNEDKE